MRPTLFYSRNPNPRLAVAVARYVKADVAFEHASPFHPAQRARFRALNPSLRIPILLEDGRSLWEADAIACRLSMLVGSDFWRGKAYFVQACEVVHFERGTKQRYGFGPIDAAVVAQGLRDFHEHAAQLDAYLTGREYLLPTGLSYADFRMASFLAFNDVAALPLTDYRQIDAWYRRIAALPAWADPFAGLDAPELPPIAVKD